MGTRKAGSTKRTGKVTKQHADEGRPVESIRRRFGLTESETRALIDCHNSVLCHPLDDNDVIFGRDGRNCTKTMVITVEDACRLDHLDQKWGISKDAIIAKLQTLTRVQAVILRMSILRYWDVVGCCENSEDPCVKDQLSRICDLS